MLVIDFDGVFWRTYPAWTVMLGYAVTTMTSAELAGIAEYVKAI